MKKPVLFIALLLMVTQVTFADVVKPEKAAALAANFLNSIQRNDANRTASDPLQLVYTATLQSVRAAEPAYYIFQRTSGSGFVIIAGDDAVDPIIGYSTESSMDISNLPPAFIEFMKGHEAAINYAKSHRTTVSEEIRNKWTMDGTQRTAAAAVTVIVSPLIKTYWNQGDPYNANCPSLRPTGCTATAMAQIMRYWNFPSTGQGSHSYKPTDFPTQSANFGATTYDWKSMTNTYSAASTAASKAAVALLMYHCGVSVDMGYHTTGGSGASINSALKAYTTYFRYTSNPVLESASANTVIGFRNKLINELNNFRPVEMRGGGEGEDAGSHAWVCDGYDSDNAFHMNWGWGGPEGYYKLSDLTPGSSDFSNNVKIIVSLEKPNRKKLSAVSSSVSIICSKSSFTCSVTEDPTLATYLWTVPSGWSVSGVVSTGVPISVGNKVTIVPSSGFDPTGGGTVTISVSGLTTYGERTPTQSLALPVGIGLPTIFQIPGSTQYTFIASAGAIIQHSTNGTSWTNAGNTYKVNVNPVVAVTIYLRATYACGTSVAKKYVLKSTPSVATSIDEEQDAAITLAPNPANDELFIKTEKLIKTIQCFNSLGQEMNVQFSDQRAAVSSLPKGVYFLNLLFEDGSLVSRKFMKE